MPRSWSCTPQSIGSECPMMSMNPAVKRASSSMNGLNRCSLDAGFRSVPPELFRTAQEKAEGKHHRIQTVHAASSSRSQQGKPEETRHELRCEEIALKKADQKRWDQEATPLHRREELLWFLVSL